MQESLQTNDQKITPKRKFFKPSLFFIFVAFIAIAVAAATSIYFHKTTLQLNQQLQVYSQKISTLTDDLKQQQAEFIKDQSQIILDSEQYRARQVYLNLQQANAALHINNDFSFALKVLQKTRTSDLSNPKFQPLIAQLDKDIQAISDVKPVAYSEIYSQLEQISQHIMIIPLIAKPVVTSLPVKTSMNVSPVSPSDWHKLPEQMKNYLQQMVVIHHADVPEQPGIYLNDPQQTRFLMQLKLNQAQIALLQKQQPIYDESLKTVSSMLIRVFYLNRDAINPDIKVLEGLRKIIITPAIPDLSASMEIASNLMSSTNEEHKK